MDHLEALKFCPKCGGQMEPEEQDGLLMPTCSESNCGFILWHSSKPCVVAVILNKEKEVLMTMRGIEPDKGKLDLPGGFLRAEETPEEGTVREIREELGVEVKVGEYIGSVVDTYFYQGIDVKTLVVGMIAEIVKGEPKINDPEEILGIEWVSPEKFDREKLAFTNNEKFLRMMAEDK
jgi:mutator protein MutT